MRRGGEEGARGGQDGCKEGGPKGGQGDEARARLKMKLFGMISGFQ